MSSEKTNKFRENSPIVSIEENDISSAHKNDIEDYEKKPTEKKIKSKPSPKVSDKAAKLENKVSFIERWKQFIAFYKNEQTQKAIGLFILLISVYLFIAFVSYLTTWEIDQDKVLGSVADLFSPDIKVQNWLGKIGALTSYLIIYRTFGLASFILIPILFMIGIRKLYQRQLINVSAFNAKWLFTMVWLSLVLAKTFPDQLHISGGCFGYFMNEQISNYFGNVGLIILYVFSMLLFLVLTINLSFKWPLKKIIADDKQIEDELEIKNDDTEDAVIFNSSFNETKELILTSEEEAALLNFEVISKNPENKAELNEIPLKDNTLDFEVLETKDELTVLNPSNEPSFEIETPLAEADVLDDENKASKLVEQFGEYDPTLDLGSYKFPTFDLLTDYGDGKGKVTQEELVANKNKIVNTLRNFGIEIEKIMATVGPTVTLYEIVPAAGVRISKIKNLEDDIALSLAALGIRIIAPIPGKGTIGIEVPNQNPEMVPMKNILASEKFNNSTFELPIALGKTISNEIFIADLAKMPHLLMAGATGQGKSVGLNAVLISLLYKKHPSQVKFVLVDPKKVELTLFKKIERHFLAKLPNAEDAIITDNTKVVHTLNSLCIEMDNRYALLEDAQVRNIKEYNVKFVNRKLNPNDGHKYLPYIVLVVDEFADLIMTAGKEVETPIARLAQLARAIGIHLIIATQRPSVNIITGTIKANFPARIAFRVTSKIDSRTILDSGGADQLIGRGDMLLSTGNDLIRIQCAFVDTPEVEKITDFIGNQRAYPSAFMLPEYVGEDGSDGKEEVDLSERDKMFDEAAKLVVNFQQGSASFLQRKLKLGYNRAGRIVDQLEAAGFIGPFEGSKAREVLVKDMAQLDEIIKKIKSK
jgi:S-DNA-T family DNA segregation ATPase FtsK/SpoIIIE